MLGGAILGPVNNISGPVQQLIRNTGLSSSPFDAWVLLKGLATVDLRSRNASSAWKVAPGSVSARQRSACRAASNVEDLRDGLAVALSR